MLQVYDSGVVWIGSSSVPLALRALDWQAAAVAACRRSELQDIEKLQRDLAGRVLELTREAIDLHSIYVDWDAWPATTVVGGTVFRLQRGELFLVRPCVRCGSRRFQSSAVRDLVDLGYALSVWDPRCEACAPEDEVWTHSF